MVQPYRSEMKHSRFTEVLIIDISKEHETGVSVSDLCRRHGVGDARVYKWTAKYGGIHVSEAERLKDLEDKNARLKRLLADGVPDNAALKDLPRIRMVRPTIDGFSCVAVRLA